MVNWVHLFESLVHAEIMDGDYILFIQ